MVPFILYKKFSNSRDLQDVTCWGLIVIICMLGFSGWLHKTYIHL